MVLLVPVQQLAFLAGEDISQLPRIELLQSLPGENFSGLHLMCLMFAGFKRVAPEADGGMDLKEPFLTALELFQNESGLT